MQPPYSQTYKCQNCGKDYHWPPDIDYREYSQQQRFGGTTWQRSERGDSWQIDHFDPTGEQVRRAFKKDKDVEV